MIPDINSLADSLLAGQCDGSGNWELSQAVEVVASRLRNAGRERPSSEQLCTMLKYFNDRRMFALSVHAGQCVLPFETNNPFLHRLFCQALIDTGALDAAEASLKDAEIVVVDDDHERLEIVGLRGRLAKQRYVQTFERSARRDRKALHEAIDFYLKAYEEEPSRPVWHGINAVALIRRADHDDIPHPRSDDFGLIVEKIRKHLLSKPRDVLNLWDYATLTELEMALGNADAAELWLYRYVTDPAITAFHLGSTLRQFSEIWRYKPVTETWGRLVCILERALVARGVIKLSTAEAVAKASEAHDQSTLEKVFGKEGFLGYDDWKRALDNCNAIARVETDAAVGVGTGFLIKGSELSRRLPDKPVFITNAHVISPTLEGALKPAEARIRFEVACRKVPNYVPLQINQLLYTSPPAPKPGKGDESCLDFSIATLHDLPADVACLPLQLGLPRLQAMSRAYVIGHPDGDSLQVSLHDSELLDYDDTKTLVHYRTPTVGGSSGSPVFDRKWQVIALHHAGSSTMPRLHGEGNYMANEGISLRAISDWLEKF